MDKIKFAALISYVSMVAQRTMSESQIEVISTLISEGTPQPDKVYEPATQEQIMAVTGHEVAAMLKAMHDNKKIDAIKICRQLTGMCLKDAKDAIEGAMNSKFQHPF